MRRLGAAAAVLALLTVACGREGPLIARGEDSGPSVPGRSSVLAVPASLERFEACDDLLGHLKTEASKRVTPFGLSSGGRDLITAMPFAADDGARAVAESGASGGLAASGEYTTTNVQEPGVDEPDIVKNDGSRLFTITHGRGDPEADSRLHAISLEGGVPRKLGELAIPQTFAGDLLLDGNWLMVLGTGTSGEPRPLPGAEPAIDIAPYGYNPSTVLVVVDVRDPANMRTTEVVRLDGWYVSARMIDGVARVVLDTQPNPIPLDLPAADIDPEQAVERNRGAIAGTEIEDWLPRFEITDGGGITKDQGPVASCDSTFTPGEFSGFGMLSVVTIDPADPRPHTSATVLGTGGTVYASARSLYVATQRYPDIMPLAEIDPAPAIRPMPEPMPSEPVHTEIHRFDISGPAATYAASGRVEGTVLNQWSMSEHEGHLRVATTEQRFTPRGPAETSNAVWVLDAEGDVLNEAGRIEGLGKPGETIFGVRFMGDVGYVVTFEQIDPLHVIDLSDPTRPVLLGELEIPGYSAYLHPVGPGRLLGVGQDVGTDGMPLGAQLSLFDVSNPADPRRISEVRIEGSYTPVEHDHHAFTWWAPASVAIVPVQTHGMIFDRGIDDGSFAPEPPQDLAVVFSVLSDQIREAGRVTHQGKDADLDRQGWPPTIQRSIVVGDTLFTMSYAGVMASDLSSLAERGWVAF